MFIIEYINAAKTIRITGSLKDDALNLKLLNNLKNLKIRMLSEVTIYHPNCMSTYFGTDSWYLIKADNFNSVEDLLNKAFNGFTKYEMKDKVSPSFFVENNQEQSYKFKGDDHNQLDTYYSHHSSEKNKQPEIVYSYIYPEAVIARLEENKKAELDKSQSLIGKKDEPINYFTHLTVLGGVMAAGYYLRPALKSAVVQIQSSSSISFITQSKNSAMVSVAVLTGLIVYNTICAPLILNQNSNQNDEDDVDNKGFIFG